MTVYTKNMYSSGTNQAKPITQLLPTTHLTYHHQNLIRSTNKEFLNTPNELRSDLMSHKQKDTAMISEVAGQIERWKWMILGGVLVGGFVLGKIDLASLIGLTH